MFIFVYSPPSLYYKLTEQYDALRLELESVDDEHTEVQNKMADAKAESQRLRESEKLYYENYNEYKLQLINYNDSHMRLEVISTLYHLLLQGQLCKLTCKDIVYTWFIPLPTAGEHLQ